MASVDKVSLRESIESIKIEFDVLSHAGKVPPEMLFLFKSLLTIVNIMAAIFLERTTKKTPLNSHKPSSQTEKDETSVSTQGSNSRGPAEQDVCSSSFRSVESTEILKVDYCEECGEDLQKIKCSHIVRRTKIDIIFERVTENFDAQVKVCPECDAETTGKFPAAIQHALEYGDGIRAYVVNLVIAQMVALARVSAMVKTIVGVALSESTILSFIMRVYKGLEEWEQQTRTALLSFPSLHCDETSCRVDKKNYWVHVYSGADGTRLKVLHRKRGTEAINDIGIIPKYSGTIVHDCWSAYLSYTHCLHALCGSHLLRELTFIVEANKYVWAQSMKELLKETAKAVTSAPQKKLTENEFAEVLAKYRAILVQGILELPEIPDKPNGKPGKVAKSDAHNLHERLGKHEISVLRFAHDPNVAFTNNIAERALRMGKVKQKVSGCFRNLSFAQAYCRISSYCLFA